MRPSTEYRQKHVYELKCYKCNHTWIKRHKRQLFPAQCPNCKNPRYWETYTRKRK